jgi:hypothetical protein
MDESEQNEAKGKYYAQKGHLSFQPSELRKYLTKIFRQFSQMRQYSVEFTTYFGLL